MKPHLSGLIAAPYTPMHPNGEINPDMVPEYAAFLERNGIIGAFVNGSSGEGVSLSVAERKILVERWVDAVSSDFKVIVHIGHTSLPETQDMAVHAQDAGAYAVGTLAPLYFRPKTAEQLAAHCAKEASVVPDLPFYYYNIPSLSLVDLPMYDFLKHASKLIPNLQGIKYTHFDLMDEDLCRRFEGGKYEILHGFDETLLAALVFGCKAAIGSTFNYAAPLYNQIIEDFNAGNLKEALEGQRKSIDLIEVLFSVGKFIPAARVILKFLELNVGPARSPLLNLTPDEEKILKENLERIKFFDYCSK